jgi:hypothetical protein
MRKRSCADRLVEFLLLAGAITQTTGRPRLGGVEDGVIDDAVTPVVDGCQLLESPYGCPGLPP